MPALVTCSTVMTLTKQSDEYSEAFKSAQATQGAENVKIDLEPMEDDVETLAKFTDALVKAAKK